MALIYIDSFDHYATADATKKGWTLGSYGAISSSQGRRSTSAFRARGTSGTRSIAQGASFVVGMAMKFDATGANALFGLIDGSTEQISVRLNSSAQIILSRNGTTLGTSSFTVSPATWYFIELKATIANSISADSCIVRVNGIEVLNLAAGTDTQATANAYANKLYIAGPGSAIEVTYTYIDDLYVCDQSGSANNDFLGDVRVDAIYPDGDGAYSEWTPSTGSTHYNLVDETAPNTTDYVSSDTVGQRDSYTFADLPAITTVTVHGLQVNAAALNDDAGARSIATFARAGSNNQDGTGEALNTSQVYVRQISEINPNTSEAWTQGGVNGAQFGVVVTA